MIRSKKMPEEILNEDTQETIICTNCNKDNSVNRDWCIACGCSLWDEQTPVMIEANDDSPCFWETFGVSFTGRRKNNQDSFSIITNENFHNDLAEKKILLIVADGVGGLMQGEMASKLAVETLSKQCPQSAFWIKVAIEVANRRIWEKSLELGQEMGTTIVAASINDQNLVMAWAGDSRLYHIRNKEVIYRTQDHTAVSELIQDNKITAEQARSHPDKSVITKSLGVKGNVCPDTASMNVEEGDYILLCSDGLCGFIEDEALCRILSQYKNVENACNALIRQALDNGSDDNITIVLARLTNERIKNR
jgi:serine/threonine protein phosphatase PrpC